MAGGSRPVNRRLPPAGWIANAPGDKPILAATQSSYRSGFDFVSGSGAGFAFFAGLDTPMLIRKNPNPFRKASKKFIATGPFPPMAWQSASARPYFAPVAGAGITAAGGWPVTISSAAGGSGLSAFASRMLTCHICISLSTSLNEGIPVSRMPLATFQ